MRAYANLLAEDGRRAPITNCSPHLLVACGVVVLVMVVGVIHAHRHPVYKVFIGTKTEIAKAMVRKYAYESYPQWKIDHPDRVRPIAVKDLTDYVNDNRIADPWGMDYVLWPFRDGVMVMSAGPDGEYFTSDDIRSCD